MKLSVRFLATFAAISLVTFAGHTQLGDMQGDVEIFGTPEAQGHIEFIDAIGMAQKSVEMEMYHLSDTAVVDALIASAQRGVQTKVILDGKTVKGKTAAALAQKMQAAGVQVMPSSAGFNLTHTKSLLIDGIYAYITSINLATVQYMTRDYGVITNDPGVIQEMQSVFDTDWANGSTGAANTPNLTNPNLVWAPVNASDRLVSLINSAQKTIIATVENITNDDIINALIAANARGVDVRLITPMCVSGDALLDYPHLAVLAQGGVSVKVMPAPADAQHPYMHGKMMVVDDMTIFIGSENFSWNSLTKSREVGLIFNQSDAAYSMYETFEQDWGVSVDVPNPLPDAKGCQAYVFNDNKGSGGNGTTNGGGN